MSCLIIAIGVLAIGAWAVWIIRTNCREEAAIKAWEQRTGETWMREGKFNKGGRNGPPQTERPPPPGSMRK